MASDCVGGGAPSACAAAPFASFPGMACVCVCVHLAEAVQKGGRQNKNRAFCFFSPQTAKHGALQHFFTQCAHRYLGSTTTADDTELAYA